MSHSRLSKGYELALPRAFVEQAELWAGEEVVMTRHPEGALLLFTPKAWKHFHDRVTALPMDSSGWKRLFIGCPVHLKISNRLTLTIPPELAEMGGIDQGDEIFVNGMGSHAEVWSKLKFLEHADMVATMR